MTLDEVTERMRQRVGDDSGLGARIKFDFGADGVILLDATQTPNVVSNADEEADCTIRISLDNFVEMGDGELSPTMAFMMGKLKVDGELGLAMKLQGLLG
jgi:putative sterol carrier protein